MSRRRRNQNRNHIPQNVRHVQIINAEPTPPTATRDTTEETPPAYEPEATPNEPPPIYYEEIPRVKIERLVPQTPSSDDHYTVRLCCRKWQFETIIEYPPSPFMNVNIFATILRVENYSGIYNTLVVHLPKTISEYRIFRVAEGDGEVLLGTGYRLVLPERPWPRDGLRAANRDEYC